MAENQANVPQGVPVITDTPPSLPTIAQVLSPPAPPAQIQPPPAQAIPIQPPPELPLTQLPAIPVQDPAPVIPLQDPIQQPLAVPVQEPAPAIPVQQIPAIPVQQPVEIPFQEPAPVIPAQQPPVIPVQQPPPEVPAQPVPPVAQIPNPPSEIPIQAQPEAPAPPATTTSRPPQPPPPNDPAPNPPAQDPQPLRPLGSSSRETQGAKQVRTTKEGNQRQQRRGNSFYPKIPGKATWFLSSSPGLVCAFFGFFVIFIKLIAPKIFTNSRNLRKTSIVYSIAQIIMNGTLVVVLFKSSFPKFMLKGCQGYVPYVNHVMLENIFKFFYIAKFIDLVGHVILAVENRFQKITHLALINDGFFILTVWYLIQTIPAGFFSLSILFETSALLASHLYYVFTSFDPCSKSLFMKILQLIHLGVFSLHAMELVFLNSCSATYVTKAWVVARCVILTVKFVLNCRPAKKRLDSAKAELYYVESTYSSFTPTYSTSDNSDLKRRIVPTLQTRV